MIETLTSTAGLATAGALLGAAAGYYAGAKSSTKNHFEELDLEKGQGFQVQRYTTGESRLKSAMRAYSRRREKDKALRKGFVRWHLVGASFSKPMYVKPEPEGGGNTPELEHDGQTYVFPEEARTPSAEDGVPIVVHREGEADPIDLGGSWDLAMDAKTLQEYLTQRVTSEQPDSSGSALPGFLADMGSVDMMRYAIIGIVLFFIVMQVL